MLLRNIRRKDCPNNRPIRSLRSRNNTSVSVKIELRDGEESCLSILWSWVSFLAVCSIIGWEGEDYNEALSYISLQKKAEESFLTRSL